MFEVFMNQKGMWGVYIKGMYFVSPLLGYNIIKICEFHSEGTAKKVKEELEQYFSKKSFKKDIKNKILENDDLIKLYKQIWQSKALFHERKEEAEKKLKYLKEAKKKLDKRKDSLLIQESNLKNQNTLLLEKIDKEKSRLYKIERRIIND
jgi:hypothetical protein